VNVSKACSEGQGKYRIPQDTFAIASCTSIHATRSGLCLHSDRSQRICR